MDDAVIGANFWEAHVSFPLSLHVGRYLTGHSYQAPLLQGRSISYRATLDEELSFGRRRGFPLRTLPGGSSQRHGSCPKPVRMLQRRLQRTYKAQIFLIIPLVRPTHPLTCAPIRIVHRRLSYVLPLSARVLFLLNTRNDIIEIHRPSPIYYAMCAMLRVRKESNVASVFGGESKIQSE